MTDNQGENLRSYLKINSIAITDLASKLDMTRQNLYLILQKPVLEADFIDRVASILSVSVEDIKAALKQKKGVPAYNVDFTAGDITQFDDEQAKVIGYVDLEGFRKCKYIVRVKGPSMEPDFKTGDFIGLEEMEDFTIIEYGQPYAITTKTKQKLVKIIKRGRDNENLILRSINKEFDDIDIKKDQILKLFKVRGPIRDQWQ